MPGYFQDNTLAIGGTPLVKLNRVIGDSRTIVLAKVEGRNPAYSVKCRVGAAMIRDAEQKRLFKPGMEIIEPTSGNTGIALAFVAAARGYSLSLTMPESMSIERRKVLKAFGANLILTDASLGMQGAVDKAEEIYRADPEHYFLPQQFSNPANPAIHEATTGPEIWRDTNGRIDALVAGVGTGGTLSGISRFLKQVKKTVLTSVAVEPAASPVISQYLEGQTLRPGGHKIQGIGAGFIPENLDLGLVDRVERVTNEEAFDFALRLAREEGILAGISCGAAVAAACRLAREERFAAKTIVVILPDSGERYLSSGLFDGLFNVHNAV